jgi:hypothetical protein
MEGIRIKALPPGPDTTPPVVALTIVYPQSDLTVNLGFNATDNVGVTGYMLSESASKPLASDTGWSSSAPASYPFTVSGAKTLYAYAKDAAGNVGVTSAAFTVYDPQLLTVTFPQSNTGSGSVNSSPGGITCTSGSASGCSSVFNFDPKGVDLVAAASAGSVFEGWTGNCTGNGTCHVEMNTVRNVAASFFAAQYVQIGSKPFPSLQDAYKEAVDGAEIWLVEGVLDNQYSSLMANMDKAVTIIGGYDPTYSRVESETVIRGQLIIKAGTVKIQNVRLRP